MELTDLIDDFIANPYPMWNNELATQLVNRKLKTFTTAYSMTACILKDAAAFEDTLPLFHGAESLAIVLPSQKLNFFYNKHGLIPLQVDDSFSTAIFHIHEAMNVFKEIPSLFSFIFQIIKSIHLLKADEPETDVSYSHPDVPFSIFISVCENISLRSTLRIAESILHEAMHLLLTLIENVLPLVKPYTREVFFSPWRDEKRPARGVLHGLFVFRAILDYFCAIKDNLEIKSERQYIKERIRQINTELLKLKNFVTCNDLTTDGAMLTANLLPLN